MRIGLGDAIEADDGTLALLAKASAGLAVAGANQWISPASP